MRSIAVGGLAAAIVMFVLGFMFFGLLGTQAFAPVAPETAVELQEAIAGILPATGTYMIPPNDEAWMAGPSAVVNYVAAGGAPDMTTAMIEGFLHFLVVALLMAAALRAVGGDFGRQAKVVLWFSLAAAVFTRLGDPIWFGFALRNSLFAFVADAVMMIAGGLVLARWFTTSRDRAPGREAMAAPAE